MATSLVLGNGNMLINIDEHMQMTDFYWPHVGRNNHLMGHHIRNYFWDIGHLVGLDDESVFKVTPEYEKDSLAGRSTIESEKFGVRILIENTILPHKDIYLARFTVTNFFAMKRSLKFFFNHDFYLKEHNVGDTACWYPMSNMLFHYKDNIYLGIGSIKGISQYSCDKSHSNGGEGTLPDPNTGKLNMYPIFRGAVESTVGFDLEINGSSTQSFDYFIVCGHTITECEEMMKYIRDQDVDHLLQDTANFWKSYIVTPIENLKSDSENEFHMDDVIKDPDKISQIKKMYARSIGVIRTQIDNDGAVIAGNDSTHQKYLQDNYSYLWHRDAALTINALDELGYTTLCEKFFRQCAQLIEKDGYFLHKYNSNGTLGSSWHPWVDAVGNPQLPIQEDETSTTLWALWKHYERHHNHELISELWETFIKPAADFLCDYRYCGKDCPTPNIIKKLEKFSDNKDTLADCFAGTNLPRPSYDLWEEQRGIFLYTCASVYGALLGASILALKLGQHEEAEKYSATAFEIKEAVNKHFYDEESGHFIHALYKDYANNACTKSDRVDSSIYGIWFFEMLPVDDPRVVKTMEWMEKALWNKSPVGGMLRYNNDIYYRNDPSHEGNPWYITTLWFAQYYLLRGKPEQAVPFIDWVLKYSGGTYLMAEQIDAYTGEELSIKPLTWSHAEFVRTISMFWKE